MLSPSTISPTTATTVVTTTTPQNRLSNECSAEFDGCKVQVVKPGNHANINEGACATAYENKCLGDYGVTVNYEAEGSQLGFIYFNSIIGSRTDQEKHNKFMSELRSINKVDVDTLKCVATEKHDGINTTIKIDRNGNVCLYKRLTKVQNKSDPLPGLIEKKYTEDISAINHWMNKNNVNTVFLRCEMVGFNIQNRQNYGLSHHLIAFALDVEGEQIPFDRFSQLWDEEIRPPNLQKVNVLAEGTFRELCNFKVNQVPGTSAAMLASKVNNIDIMPSELTTDIEGVVIQPERELLYVPTFRDTEASNAIQEKKRNNEPLPCFVEGTDIRRRFCYKLLADWVAGEAGASSAGGKVDDQVKKKLADKLFNIIEKRTLIKEQGALNNRKELSQKISTIFSIARDEVVNTHPGSEEILVWGKMKGHLNKRLVELIKQANPQLFQVKF
ncbi:RNA ligase family protein [Endozoicomonas sp. YOMI1]|uniref:RNA ligase family protein n=1 Tax=Endozoicomonas sp. YOMI1 TaxID=2828739 RepID=UPI0021489C56|nr:RNA ligase family protein [Endozoicomonas sp. YOMI1]